MFVGRSSEEESGSRTPTGETNVCGGQRSTSPILLKKPLTVETVENVGEPLSAYEVAYDAAGGRSGAGMLLGVNKPTLFGPPRRVGPTEVLFGLSETVGDDGWLRAFRLADHAARKPPRPGMPQRVLFAYTDAI